MIMRTDHIVWIREMRNRPFKINRHYKILTIKCEMAAALRGF